jgi:hypothetical protein
MAVDIVLVHSGAIFPPHINDCISLLTRQNINIHLILETKLRDCVTNKNIEIISIDGISDIRYHNYDIINYDTKFRDAFYRRTSSRFIIIDNYARSVGLKNFFHIENDIALFSDLGNIQDYLDRSSYDTCLIMDNYWRCVPSIIWYKNTKASNRLSDFIYQNNSVDDMQNLARYFHQHRDYITNFPIVPFDLLDDQYNINYGNMHKDMSSIFDGAAIGQYLYGVDTNNAHHNDTCGFINETCVIDYSKFHIERKPTPSLIIENKKIPINNLHMHCKNIGQLL